MEAFLFYYQINPNLADSFEKEAGSTFKYISENPNLFEKKRKSFHEAVMKVFPFVVVYQNSNSKIIVHAIFHTSKSPKRKFKK